jgi:hypothetical protein
MEFRRIFEHLPSEYFEISSKSRMKASELVNVLGKERPHIIHFSGHGSPDEIIFEDKNEKTRPVQKNHVIEIFRHLSKKPKMVFLNACWTAENLDDLGRLADFVIATRNTVFDEAAIGFAEKFYESLGQGQPVRNAFDLTKDQFDIEGTSDQVVMYELFVRKGAGKGKMVKRPSTGKEEPSPETPGNESNIMTFNKSTVKGNTISQGNRTG